MATFAYKTDLGLVREKNEDNAYIHQTCTGDVLMMVLDGMGGHNKGEKASQMAMDIIVNRFKNGEPYNNYFKIRRVIVNAIKKANKEVNYLGTSNIEYYEMGTTVVMAYLYHNKLFICNVGDSRCYAVRDNKLVQMTEDQTYVQFLYRTGKIKKEEMATHPKRHVLMNALGTYPSVSIVTKISKIKNQKVLLCSDGLYNMLSEEEIMEILNKEKMNTAQKVDALIKAANDKGGVDNIAVSLWEA